jgi:predicted RNA-binding protein YlxR (DUF448 family)
MTTPDRDERRGPVRSCIGCRTKRTSDQLVRLTRAAGRTTVDGVSNGRGAWLCRVQDAGGCVVRAECLDQALRKRAFGKAWRTSIGQADEDEIRETCGGGLRGDHRDAVPPAR